MGKLTKFQKIALLVLGVIIFLSWIDVQTKFFWTTPREFGLVFWRFSYAIILALIILYYILRRDKSEAVSIGVLFVGGILSGIEDFAFFLFEKIFSTPHLNNFNTWLPLENNYLNNMGFIGIVRNIFHSPTVTPIILITSVLVGSFITYKIAEYLYHKM